jgi:acyl-coenzyme A thioesterase PaaI-like protein
LKFALPYYLLSFYPPFMGTGIWVKKVTKTTIKVIMLDLWYNRNVYGTHFGGSLYAMCDPFFILILHRNLGNNYIYWDKSAKINYLKPGNGKVEAIFEIPLAQIDTIKKEIEIEKRKSFVFTTSILDNSGSTIATVEKEIFLKKKH